MRGQSLPGWRFPGDLFGDLAGHGWSRASGQQMVRIEHRGLPRWHPSGAEKTDRKFGVAFRSAVRVYRQVMDENPVRDQGPRVPAACTLSPAQQPVRGAQWGDMFGTDVLEIRRDNPTSAQLVLRPDPVVAARAADRAFRETQCCSFFVFTQTASGGTLTVEVVVPPAQSAALDALLGLAPAAKTGVS